MPVYRYICPVCNHTEDLFRKVSERDNAPLCHRVMERRIVPTMVQVFTPYRAIAYDEDGKRPLIRNSREHRDFLRRNGYEEIGNDKSMAPKPPEEVAESHAKQRKELEETTFTLTDEDFNG